MAIDEYGFNRYQRAKLLNALGYIVKEAHNPDNEKVYFDKVNIGHGDMNKGIIICDINALSGMQQEIGDDFNPEYMLRGMQAVTQDEDGYCMSVKTTHDLYCATIPDISELIYRIRQIDR
jgi:hypothetical protein